MYRILDLFSGAGGFSKGLDSLPEFETVVATDFNASALETFQANFPQAVTILGDICEKNVKDHIVATAKEKQVNMMIGGPPCQGFSNKGKKLGLQDPRNFLFLEYLDLVEKLQPELFIIENVKTLSTACDGYFLAEIQSKVQEMGYIVNADVLLASDYGVPQGRERTFIIASKKKFLHFPIPTVEKEVTVRDAISDLSYLKSGQGSLVAKYKKKPESAYQEEMRKNSTELTHHEASHHSEETIHKLSLIPAEKGKEYLPEEYHGKQKFKTTWSRLVWDEVSPTIDTRFDTPSNGKNTHPELLRAITPREAARLQSFPDDFIFKGKKTHICTQIGNAVPPLMSKAIGEAIIRQLNSKSFQVEGKFQIYNNDAYAMIKELKNSGIKVDHIITDPPYNISVENNFHTMKKPRAGVDFGEWDKGFNLYGWITDYVDILDKNGSVIIFCSYLYLSYIIAAMEQSGLVVKDVLKWVKTNPMPRNINRRYVQDTEYAIWGVKKNAKWVFNKPKNKPYLRGEFKSSVVSGGERVGHPTQKSLSMMKEILRIHTNKGQTIIDPFMGSGTTGVAATTMGRKFIGVEIDSHYYDLSKKRLETGK